MSAAEDDAVSEVMDRVSTWSHSQRITLARRSLESIEGPLAPEQPGVRSLKNLVGLLRTDSPAPSDEECRKILEEERPGCKTGRARCW